ncbi:MAG TPA: hypothetical protein GXZ82_14750 [Firmicutes bacterium]|nr:hypothetical protein [Bacillota bacterium]
MRYIHDQTRRISHYGFLCLIGLFLLLLAAPVSASDFTLRVQSPDTGLDTSIQSIGFSASAGGWQLDFRHSKRIGKLNSFNGMDQLQLQKSFNIGTDATLNVAVGRAVNNWSLWQGDSVVLSSHAPGVDQFQYTYRQGKVSFDKIIGKLSGEDRYILAHRLSVTIGNLTGVIGESVIADGQFAKNWINLIIWPYYWTQWIALQSDATHNNKVNANVFLQALYENEHGFRLGGEVFIDDMPQWVGIKQLFQIAGQIYAEIPFTSSRLSLQYSRVNNYTYAFQVPFGDYSHHGYSLGSSWGPDNDELVITYGFPRSRIGLESISLALRRKGEGNFGDSWEHDGYDAHRDKQFLSGIVEYTQALYGTASYQLGPNWTMHAQWGGGPMQNAKNKAGYNKIHSEGYLEIRYHLD